MAEIRNLTRNGETFYPLTTTSAVINESTGEGLIIDDVPVEGSDNLVKSGGVAEYVNNQIGKQTFRKYISDDVSNEFLGYCKIQKNEPFILRTSGTMKTSRIIIGADNQLLYRLFDDTKMGGVYELIATQDINRLYLFTNGTIAGNIEVEILTGEARTIYKAKISETRNLFEFPENENLIKNIVYGMFLTPDATQVANSGWCYSHIPVTPGEKYSVSGSRVLTCYFDENGNVISGGEDIRQNVILTIPSNVVSLCASFPIANKYDMFICKSETIVTIDNNLANPSKRLNVYNKDEINILLNSTIIEVGAGKQFTEVYDAFMYAVQLNKACEIRIYDGNYNYYQEFGGESFISNISSTATWNQILPTFVKPIKIVGIGDVTIELDIPSVVVSQYESTCKKLSIINNKGEISVNNISLIVNNCRYAVHDECDSNMSYSGTKHIYNNMRVQQHNCSASFGVGAASEIFEFNNLFIDSNGQSGIYFHTWPEAKGLSLTIKDCVIIGFLNLSNYGSSRNDVKFISTFMSGMIYISTEDSTNYPVNQYDILILNSNKDSITLNTTVTSNPYPVKVYNY